MLEPLPGDAVSRPGVPASSIHEMAECCVRTGLRSAPLRGSGCHTDGLLQAARRLDSHIARDIVRMDIGDPAGLFESVRDRLAANPARLVSCVIQIADYFGRNVARTLVSAASRLVAMLGL